MKLKTGNITITISSIQELLELISQDEYEMEIGDSAQAEIFLETFELFSERLFHAHPKLKKEQILEVIKTESGFIVIRDNNIVLKLLDKGRS